MQGRGDIASKQQGSPLRTDYNKLATLIERKGKLSALFACNAMPIKVGEGFCNLRLVTLFDRTRWLRVHRKSVTFVTVSIWYSLDSFNSSLKAFGVMNRKPFRKKERIQGWLREPTVTKVTGPMRPVTGNRKVPGKRRSLCKVGLLITN